MREKPQPFKLGNALDRISFNFSFRDNNNSHRRKIDDKLSKTVASNGKESYELMIENSKLGEMCVIEKCFVFTGTTEQSLMLVALKHITDLERMVSF